MKQEMPNIFDMTRTVMHLGRMYERLPAGQGYRWIKIGMDFQQKVTNRQLIRQLDKIFGPEKDEYAE